MYASRKPLAFSVSSIAAQIRRHRVTHLQCTPSLAALLASEPEAVSALSELQRWAKRWLRHRVPAS